MNEPREDIGAPGRESEQADRECEYQKDGILLVKTECDPLSEADADDSDRRNRQTDGSKRRTEREVNALLQLIASSGRHGRHGLRQ